MDLATTLSITALGVSVAAAGFTAWQAVGQSRGLKIERERRHDERTPKFSVKLRPVGQVLQLSLKLESPWPLSRVEVRNGWGFPMKRVSVGYENEPWKPYPGDFELWNVTKGQNLRPDMEIPFTINCQGKRREKWVVFVAPKVTPY